MSHCASWSADPQAGSFEFSLRIEILSFNTETIFEQAAIEIQIGARKYLFVCFHNDLCCVLCLVFPLHWGCGLMVMEHMVEPSKCPFPYPPNRWVTHWTLVHAIKKIRETRQAWQVFLYYVSHRGEYFDKMTPAYGKCLLPPSLPATWVPCYGESRAKPGVPCPIT